MHDRSNPHSSPPSMQLPQYHHPSSSSPTFKHKPISIPHPSFCTTTVHYHRSSPSTNPIGHHPPSSPTNPSDHHPFSTAVAATTAGADHHGNRDRLQQPAYKHLYPPPHETNPCTWFAAIFCVLFWIIIILGGLFVLIVYLIFQPKSPHLEISSFTLNGAYLDMGSLLNADVTVLANFTNPNTKVDISFDYLAIDLYFGSTLIAAQAIEPFMERRGETVIRSIHLVTSQVTLSMEEVNGLKKQVGSNRISFDVVGSFRTRSNLGNFFHYSYWLYGRCNVVVSDPPVGVLLSSRCRTKR